MKSMIIVMALMGCGDDGGQCEVLKEVSGNWETLKVCEAQADNQISALSNSNFPMITARCSAREIAPHQEAVTAPHVITPSQTPQADAAASSTFGSYVPGYDAAKDAFDWAGETTTDLAFGAANWVKDAAKFGS